MTTTRHLSLPAALLALLACHAAHAAFPTVALRPVVLQQIHSPTVITHAPDGSGRLFVCDQHGKIFIIRNGMMLPAPFLNLASPANTLIEDRGPGPVITLGTGYSERGLLGLAFHPGFADPGSPGYRKFYVNYIKADADGEPDPPQAGDPVNCITVIDEFEVSAADPDLADPASQRRVLAFTQPQANHNGGALEFGPDSMLYIGSGDGGSSNDNAAGHTGREVSTTACLGNSQDKTRYLGKILRINPLDPDGGGPLTYSIPADNPFFSDATPGLKIEIYALGLRNPWKFSFDWRPGGTDRLFCGDVGQGRIEEINLIVSGGNYGWRYQEGLELPTFSSGAGSNPMPHPGGVLITPIAMYAHPGVNTSPPLPQLGLSVTGGHVYRGQAIPEMQGKYVFGDYGSTGGASDGRLMGLEETAPGSGVFTLTQALPLFGQANPVTGERILCLGEDEAGEIYIGMKSNAGVLARIGGLPAGGIYQIVPVETVTTVLNPQLDNTIYSEDGGLSDARGYFYAGRTGPNHGPYLRRALLSFNVEIIPPEAALVSASLKLRLNKLGPGGSGTPMALHRLNQTWGEGTSKNPSDVGTGAPATPGDATWSHRFHDTSTWTTPGGVFEAAPSAAATADVGTITFGPSAQMLADAQAWHADPAANAGWMLRGDETQNETVGRFDSKEVGQVFPELEIQYQLPPPVPPFGTWLKGKFPALLTGQFVDIFDDQEGDSIPLLLEYALGFDPFTRDTDSGLHLSVAPGEEGGTDLTLTFRRETAATDLVLRLEMSASPVAWGTPLAEVSAGQIQTMNGADLIADDWLVDTTNLVTLRLNLPETPGQRRFVRMSVDWQ
ncbi:MAG TPA: PQQ-dependent sugar dehydrogenase [Prosthecobacter sp.]|nr:PQQ-dependent sugar dehydrogenase [Prosthecobacter sp.]HRK13451.1 PQQ-dependent sugar dehydrogenase [Prosthecobacter sp.]